MNPDFERKINEIKNKLDAQSTGEIKRKKNQETSLLPFRFLLLSVESINSAF